MKHFQPSPKCGNCLFFRRSVKDKDKIVLEPAGCGKDHESGKDCLPEDFKPRGKKTKFKARKRKFHKESN